MPVSMDRSFAWLQRGSRPLAPGPALVELRRCRLFCAGGRQGAADRLADVGRLRLQCIAQPAQLAAQAVNLIDQAEDQRHRLLVDRKFAADVENELDASDVDLVKGP